MTTTSTFIGIDVSKAYLDCVCRPLNETLRVTNDSEGIEALVNHVQCVAPSLVVLAATDNVQMAAVATLAAAGLPVAVVNPRQVRDFATATGQRAKTDIIDARVLAHGAEATRPEPWSLPGAATHERKLLLTRRRQLLDTLTAQQQRVANAPSSVRDHIKRSIG